MEIIIGIICFVIGAGGGAGITAVVMKNKPPGVVIVEPDKTSEKQQETILQLTDIDLAKEICEKQGGTLLCREVLCLQFSRGKRVRKSPIYTTRLRLWRSAKKEKTRKNVWMYFGEGNNESFSSCKNAYIYAGAVLP